MVKNFSSREAGQKIISSLMDEHTKIVRPMRSTIIESSMEFASRSLNIFNKLTPIEVKHETWMLQNETYDSFDQNNNVSPPEISSEVFKKPLEPVSRRRKARSYPFKKDRKKWIKYSLEDIPLSSDATNSAVAFQFLNELRERKKGKVDEVTGSDDKVVFRKPMKRSPTATNSVSSSSVDNNKVEKQHSQCLPVSGKKMRKLNDIKLHHLEEDSND